MAGFIVFIAVFLSIYSGLHTYAFIKFRQAFHPTIGISLAVCVILAVMVIAPIAVRLLERSGYDQSARTLAYIGFTWMGVLFIFVSSAFLFDLYKLLLSVSQWVSNTDLSRIFPSPRLSFTGSLVLTCLVSGYGFFEAIHIQTEHVVIRTSKLPKGVDRLRIVQISDIHLGLIVGESRLERILAAVKEAGPDILISTGDLVDGQMARANSLSTMLRNIESTYGKYAVTGNHEFYAGIDKSIDFTKQAGFHVLRGDSVRVADTLVIAGVDDDAGSQRGGNPIRGEEHLLANIDRDLFVLFLKHAPVLNKKTLGQYDLQLSGHAHKGQIFPFSLFTALAFPVDSGLLELGSNSALYVNRGSGTWGPPIRFLSPPEVTVIDLMKNQ